MPPADADFHETLRARYGVVAALRAGAAATLDRAGDLGDGFAAAVWRNARDRMRYRMPGHHTVSLYLEGGEGTVRTDRPGLRGAPGRLCLLPADHESGWAIDGPLRFVHLYFGHAALAATGIRLWDVDIRENRLRDDTFYEDPRAAELMGRIAGGDWSDPAQRLVLTEAGHDLLAHLATHAVGRRETPRLKAGLGPAARRRVLDFIENALAEPLTLSDLARVTALSEYHFSRMFALSVGMPPHRYVLARRMALARRLLRESAEPQPVIAEACGFAHASHLSRVFRAVHGAPPDAWRRAVRSPAP